MLEYMLRIFREKVRRNLTKKEERVNIKGKWNARRLNVGTGTYARGKGTVKTLRGCAKVKKSLKENVSIALQEKRLQLRIAEREYG
jgi:pyruvate kinase